MTAIASGYTASPSPRTWFAWADAPSISFITVTFGTGDVIGDCLASLRASLDGHSIEMIVVDNPHPQHGHRTADRLALSTSGVRLVQPAGNLGFGGGNELGVLHSRADLLCFINPDLLFSPGWLGPLVDQVRCNPMSISAPRLRNLDGSLQERGQRLLSNARTRPILDPAELADNPPDYASAACWMMTRTLHERSGGFDPRFHPAYFEDVDVALRVRRIGGSTLIADSDVVHLLGGSTVDATTPPAEAQRETLIELWADDLRRQPVS